VPQDAEWKILAEEAEQEKDPVKLLEIIFSLVDAIDKDQSRNSSHFHRPTQRPTNAPAA
jgi:hypothetical protein